VGPRGIMALRSENRPDRAVAKSTRSRPKRYLRTIDFDILSFRLERYDCAKLGHMSNRKTSVLIDEELLVAVKAVLNTKTVKDTIERAFLEVLRAKAREEEVEALSIQKGMELNDDEVMSRAWRH